MRPQSVKVGALWRTPPTGKERAQTSVGVGGLRRGVGWPVVAERSREKLNEAFKRTSALLQRCKGSEDSSGEGGCENGLEVSARAPSNQLSGNIPHVSHDVASCFR